LGFATGALAGHYAFHLWKTLERVITETVKRILTSSLSLYYKGGFEQKMTGREDSLILSPYTGKAKVKTGDKKKKIFNHLCKGRSLYVETEVNQAKD
ncbi:DJC15 protein, partial [Phainopepla nitens]|nr:DJC15 protein [Phainopepla nitens]